MKMNEFEKQALDELEKKITEDKELVLLVKITEFANWLDEGVKVTDNPMVKKVFENYLSLFGEYLSKVEDADE